MAVGKGRNSYNYGAATTSKKQSTAMPSWTDWAEAKPVDEEFLGRRSHGAQPGHHDAGGTAGKTFFHHITRKRAGLYPHTFYL